jgi:hypothetical protein
MVFLKDMVNIHGMIKVIIKVILNKDYVMDMVYGDLDKNKIKFIKDIIVWTKNQDMEYINGEMDGYIKEILIMIIEMGLGNFIMEINLLIEGSGKMENRRIKKLGISKIQEIKVLLLKEINHQKFIIEQ